MSRFIYTSEMLAFIAEQYKKTGLADVTAAFNAKFGTDKTTGQLKSTLKNHGITCGRTTGEIRKGVLLGYTQEQASFIRKHYQELALQPLTQAFNAEFGTQKTEQQIRSFTRNHGVKSGRTGKFEKGETPWNTGKKGWTPGGRSVETRFKKGHQRSDIKPVGATRICSKDGYVWVKVAMPNKWRQRHVVEWEKHNGPIPKGSRLWFIDNNRENWQVSNLMLITRAQGAVINKQRLGTVAGEHKAAVVAIADIAMKRRSLIEQGQKNDR